MNVLDAKNEIKRTVTMYLQKDEYGEYVIDEARQRPVFLLGAPGIGKTAIVGQVASEMGIGFVSYTITHHTRQSAIGLPYIEKENFLGEEYSVTKYTISEIIASVYEAIEKNKQKEGILFIDEINCVSETLAPAMLELLQNKRFGPHRIPKGWILISAGNPPEYNKSVRDFDVVTLDRVKKIEVTPNFEVWKKYAVEQSFNPAVIYYLSVKPDRLFVMNKCSGGYNFVTPRGWEDLSVAITEYKLLGYEITVELILQYVQDGEIASEFARYYELYERYNRDYDVDEVLSGKKKISSQDFLNAKFDEKFAVTEVISSALSVKAKEIISIGRELELLKKYKDIGSEEELDRLILQENTPSFDRKIYTVVKNLLGEKDGENKLEKLKAEKIKVLDDCIKNAFTSLDNAFGKGQEITAFAVNLLSDVNFVTYIAEYGSETFYKYNRLLLVDDEGAELKQQINELLGSKNV